MIPSKFKTDNRSGVALIIVLGLVAVLMITTVAFTTTMRVERSGSANLRHSTLANQVVKGALAYALADLDYCVPPTEPMPLWRNTNDVEQLYWTYKRENSEGDFDEYTLWKDTMVSIAGNSCDADVLSAEAEHYLMPGIAYKGYAKSLIDGSETAIDQPQWVAVRPDGTNVTGRFAYIIFNNSGLLDINAVNGADRRLGQYPEEIQVTKDVFGSEFKSQNEIDNLFASRDDVGEFANVYEMFTLGNAPNTLASFDTFSHSPISNTNGFSLVDISGGVNDIKGQRKEIMEAFYRSGLVKWSGGYDSVREDGRADSEQALWGYLAMVDYVDTNNEPEGANDDEKYCRPVSEEMPVFAGGEALVTITRTQGYKLVSQTDPATGKKRDFPMVDTENCEYELRVMGKIPFSWDFDKQVPEETYECEGKMAVLAGDNLDAKFEPLLEGLNDVVTMRSLFDRDRMPVCAAPNGEFNSKWVFKKTASVAEQSVDADGKFIMPDLTGFSLKLCFAGRTFLKGKSDPVRIFPFDKDFYADNMADERWLKVSLDAWKEDLEFKPEEGKEPYTFKKQVEYTDYDGAKKTEELELSRWVAHKVVWNEIFDPYFANLSMKEWVSEDFDGYGFSRPSVNPELKDDKGNLLPKSKRQQELTRGGPTQYLSKMPTSDGKFDDFDAASNSATAFNGAYNVDQPDNERDEDDTYNFNDCGYFTSERHWTSPLTDYILEHEEILGGVDKKSSYGLYADGLQYGAYGKGADPAFAQRRRFVRNDKIESVGELGYFQIGPYSTIKLFDHGWGDGVGDGSPLYDRDGDQFVEFSTVPGYGALVSLDSMYEFKPWKMKVTGNGGKILPDCRGFHTVLDYFTTSPDVTRGKVNINSSLLTTLASAYYDMPVFDGYRCDINNHSSKDTCKRLNKARAFDMAYLLSSVKGGFSRLSDFGRIFDVKGVEGEKKKFVVDEETDIENLAMGAQILYAAIKGNSENGELESVVQGKTGYSGIFKYGENNAANTRYGEFERESLIRNACGLFTDRGQSFTIVLRAEAFSSYFGSINVKEGTVNAVKTAVAQVWRDSAPSTIQMGTGAEAEKKQINPFVVRSFKIIDE